MALPSRRAFNNILIIGILVFIALMNLPTYLRSKVAEYDMAQQSQQNAQEGVISLIPSDLAVKALQFPDFTLTNGTPWQTDIALDISPNELAGRWMNLSGTEINADMLKKLKPSLHSPSTLVVDLGRDVEPLRLTYYQLPQFWLIQNAENRWLAVSVDPHYLFPLAKPELM